MPLSVVAPDRVCDHSGRLIQVVAVATGADAVEEAAEVVNAVRVTGIRVIRVFEDLITLDDAIDRVTRIFGGEPDGWAGWPRDATWPVPVGVLGGEMIWRWNEVLDWLYADETEKVAVTAREVAAINVRIETTR